MRHLRRSLLSIALAALSTSEIAGAGPLESMGHALVAGWESPVGQGYARPSSPPSRTPIVIVGDQRGGLAGGAGVWQWGRADATDRHDGPVVSPPLPPAPDLTPEPASGPAAVAVTWADAMQACRVARSAAHPWRRKQIDSALMNVELAGSYRASPGGLNPSGLRDAIRQERDAVAVMLDTCRPVLAARL